jgi:sigma-E factor negative regulatory protein RseC
MKCTGTVLQSKGEIARVYIESNACDQCHACGFGAVRDKKAMEVNALNDVGAEEGDQVHLEVSGKKVMEASAIIFLIPFAGFILGFLLGYLAIGPLVHAKTASGIIVGFALLAASYYLVYLLGNKSEFEFIIKEVLVGGESPASRKRPVTTN